MAAGALRANPLGIPIGSQTYPHRQRIKDGDFAGLCRDIAALGIGNLELCSPGVLRVRRPVGRQGDPQDPRRRRPAVSQRPLRARRDPRAPAAGHRLGPRHRHDPDGHRQPRRPRRERHHHHGHRKALGRRVQQDRRGRCQSRHAAVPPRRALRDVQGRWPPRSTKSCSSSSIPSSSRCSSRCPPCRPSATPSCTSISTPAASSPCTSRAWT